MMMGGGLKHPKKSELIFELFDVHKMPDMGCSCSCKARKVTRESFRWDKVDNEANNMQEWRPPTLKRNDKKKVRDRSLMI